MKEDRIEFRISHEERVQFEMAATHLGMNLSAFLRMAALERSAKIVKESNVILLSDRDRMAFLSALENPPEPNKNLKKALSEYNESKRAVDATS